MRYVILLCLLIRTAQAQDYFQQHVDYTIRVSLNDDAHYLRADEEIHYTNNAPKALDTLWFHLWPNAYSSDETALAKQLLRNGEYDFHYAGSEERGFIDSLDFKVNGTAISWGYHAEHPDIAWLKLNEPLPSGGSATISTPFRVKLPDARFSRLGHVKQSYMITQWYPKPAVFDKEGWHAIPYLDQGEFYSEFGSFTVQVTLPENYVVGATGDLQEESEQKWLDSLANATPSKLKQRKTLYIEKYLEFPVSSKKRKTLTYKASNVHDFAWFADKRWLVLKGEVALPHSGRSVTTWAMFTGKEAHLWEKSLEYLHDATHYYSLWNGDYPYNHVTAVDGTIAAGGGMEYPNITVIGSSYTNFSLETVIMHEVGHNWFYGILGSNERRHAWMDEGLNSLNESRYIGTKYPGKKITEGYISVSARWAERLRLDIFKYLQQYQLFYLINATRTMDQPMDLGSDDFTGGNYGGIVYSKTAVMFNYLRNYLGDAVFDQCMQAYFERWKFKHPQPEDLKAVFEEVTGRDMSWFFSDIIQTTGTLDFSLRKAQKPDKNTVWRDAFLKVNQAGTLNGPFSITGVRNDSALVTMWYDSVPENGIVQFPIRNVDYWRIDHDMVIPEISRKNNILKAKGAFKRTEPLRLQFFSGLEDPEKTTIYWLPLIAGNTWDGVMLGAGIHNFQVPERRWQYVLMPMYGIRSGRISGMAHSTFRLRTTHSKLFQQAYLNLHLRSFATGDSTLSGVSDDLSFTRFGVNLMLRLRSKTLVSPHTNVFDVSINNVTETQHSSPFFAGYAQQTMTYADVFHRYTLKKPMLSAELHSGIRLGIEDAEGEQLLSIQEEARLAWRYHRNGHLLKLRVFFGGFLMNQTTSGRYNWQLDGPGTYLGGATSDFRYEHFMLGRNLQQPDFLSQQLIEDHGGFASYTRYSSNDWIASGNVKFQLPFIVGINIYGSAAALPFTRNTPQGYEQGAEFFGEAGLSLTLIKDIIELYFPVYATQNISNEWQTNDIPFVRRIRFTFNLNNAHPMKLIERAL